MRGSKTSAPAQVVVDIAAVRGVETIAETSADVRRARPSVAVFVALVAVGERMPTVEEQKSSIRVL